MMTDSSGEKVHRRFNWLTTSMGLLLLVASGIGYRAMAKYLRIYEEMAVKLPRQLAVLPMQCGDWAGKDVPISISTLRVARNDDYINRLYIDGKNNEWVNLYIAYTARPRNMLGHKPQKCYVGGGWVHDGTEASKVILDSGSEIPCLIHRFHRPAPANESIVVLNFYIVNGRVTNDESVFSGVGWRTPNINGNPARYVTQVQISSMSGTAVLEAAKGMTGEILDFFPDVNGKVKAAESVLPVGDGSGGK